MSHIIRLRSAWETTATGEETRHARNFGRPRTLDAHERVWLICEHIPAPAQVLLNGQKIGAIPESGSFAVDITESLQARNSLLFEVSSAQPLGAVSIEIRAQT